MNKTRWTVCVVRSGKRRKEQKRDDDKMNEVRQKHCLVNICRDNECGEPNAKPLKKPKPSLVCILWGSWMGVEKWSIFFCWLPRPSKVPKPPEKLRMRKMQLQSCNYKGLSLSFAVWKMHSTYMTCVDGIHLLYDTWYLWYMFMHVLYFDISHMCRM